MVTINSLILALSGSIAAVKAAPIAEEKAESTTSAESTSSVDLFPTTLGYLGPTSTAGAPFLAQTDNVAAKTGQPTNTYGLPEPIETTVQSLDHKDGDRSIYELFGNISPYYVSDQSWGIYEYAMPDQCTIEQMHLLSRHGTRYSTSVSKLPKLLKNATSFSGNLSFLSDWEWDQGLGILTSLGNQQLFDKGVRTFFRYGALYNWTDTETKIVARSTTQERMTMTAEYFLLGFFGTKWEDYANLELIIEEDGFNNTLNPQTDCSNSYLPRNYTDGTTNYLNTYLANATERINSMIEGVNLTAAGVMAMQEACSYETNTLGYSKFCGLFTQQEWEDYEYYLSWNWYDSIMYGAPYGKAAGAGWVEEFKDRLEHIRYNGTNQAEQNATLDENPVTFPLNQSLYFDFTHDSYISAIYTALGFQQFKSNFSDDATNPQPFDLSRVVPFGSQTYIEIISCDEAVPEDRSALAVNGTSTTQYVHFLLNDHTLPLHANIPEYCPERADGWCELGNFTTYLNTLYETSQYDRACNADYNVNATVTDGVPPSSD